MSSVATSRARRVLIYFGLAEDPSTTPEQRTARDATWIVVMSVLVVAWLRGDEGRTVALVIGAALLPSALIAAGTKLRSGAINAFCDRHLPIAEAVATPFMLCGLAWLIVPSATSDWIPIALGGVCAVSMLAAAVAQQLN